MPSHPPGTPARPYIPEVVTPSPQKLLKAEQLYNAALRDRDAGNLVSARMNLKLAIAFAPDREAYQALFNQLSHVSHQTRAEPRNEAARDLYLQAEQAEMQGDIDASVRKLIQALETAREAVIFNRLGVVLATRKRDFVGARRCLEEAVRLAPENPAYVHNLSKVLDRLEPEKSETPSLSSKKGFWRRLIQRGR